MDLSLFFWNSPDLMCVAGGDGFLKKANPSFIAAIGYSESELQSRPYISLVHPDDVQRTIDETLNLAESGGKLQFTNRLICKDGSIRWIAWKTVRLGTDIFAIGRDKTEMRESERALRTSERQVSLLLEKAPVTLFLVDSRGTILTSIGKGIELAGYRPGHNIGKNLLEIHSTRADIVEPLKSALAGNRSASFLQFDGLEYELLFEPVLTEDGKVDHVIGVSVIVTDQQRLQADLQDRKLANSMPQIVWTASAEGAILYFNSRWYEYTQFPAGDISRKSWESTLHPDDLGQFKVIWEHSISTGQPFEIEFRLKDLKMNRYRWFLGRAVAMRNDDGTVHKWVATCTDVDDQKFALIERQALIERESAAREASRLKSQFLANMSHEIRTPLNGVVGMANLLRDSKLSKSQREYANIVVQSAEHLQSVVNDILDLSKIESNRLQLDFSNVDIDDLVEKVSGTLRNFAKEKGVEFAILNEGRKNVHFVGDAIRLQQVLLNLAQNAIKFTDHGGVSIRYQSKFDRLGHGTVRFEVQDSGVGIAKESFSSIFEPFSQADSSITRKFGGTGLGLSICRRLVELMGGGINVESEPGVGSTFSFEIPVELTSKGSNPTKKLNVKAAIGKSVRSYKILVAEDHPVNQRVIQEILEQEGHIVTLVEDGNQAIKEIRENGFDLILMDCHMPLRDGFSATKEIRTMNEVGATIPIIALTADALETTRKKCLAGGMDGYVSKPIDNAFLFEEIERAVNGHASLPNRRARAATRKFIDIDAIEKLRKLNKSGGDDFAEIMVSQFLEKMPARLTVLEKWASEGQWKKIAEEAHKLKSAAAAVGAAGLGRTAERLENESNKGSGAEARKLCSQLRRDLVETDRELRQALLSRKKDSA